MQFWGYKRKEGRAGIRNHVLILPTCACGSESCRIVASQVRGAVNIVFNTGCSDVAANTAMSQKVLTGFACNPNVYGVVIIGLGCETVPHAKLREKIQAMTSKPVVSFGIQEEGGTLKTIEKAVRAASKMAAEAAMQPKELCDISELMLGIECGGSDATSGIASNPAVGELSDLLVDLGATTMMSESIEWIGGEHLLAKRAATPAIHNQIIQVCKDYEAHLKSAGQDCRAGQPTPGNKAGGLSTLDEKSLGCIRKGGTRPIVEVLEQAVPPTKRGAVVMDTAGYDISSVTSMVAAGCNAVIFTTGRGTCTGNAIVPVLKVTANARTYQHMEDNMDVDLSPIVRGEKTYQEMGAEMLNNIQDKLMNGAAADEQFLAQVSAVVILFCCGGTGWYGALNEGLTGDGSILITKSILDFVTACIFGSILGKIVPMLCIPQAIIYGALFLVSGAVQSFITPDIIADFSATGGIITLCAGLSLAGIKKDLKVLNLLPSLILIFLISSAWTALMG